MEGFALMNNLICLPPTGIGSGPIAPWLIWALWTTPNQLIFNKKAVSAEEALSIAMQRAREWQKAQVPPPKTDQRHTPNPQPPRLRSNTTYFTDAAWRDGSAGLGWAIIDQSGQIQAEGSSSTTHVSSPLMAEALATLTAVRVAIESNIRDISFASDSFMLVQALNQKFHQKELHGTLHDVLSLSSNFNVCSFNFVSRTLNHHADRLTKNALRSVVL
ncbi:PREDICTED: uncharacterized protein LOC104772516 [Camelina sativa]|uniref:Uncharacterized protein LOC104772516 n=1 Tax=Camelina sativa TaxID=90675 RepID=A0ABM0Y4M9_CAMSA|nr:PREDICTED: uncharacterized protein LOC104772516 [Camelina sativa]